MNVKPLILSTMQLKQIADLPEDARIKSVGMTGEFDKAVIFIESETYEPKDYGHPIVVRCTKVYCPLSPGHKEPCMYAREIEA